MNFPLALWPRRQQPCFSPQPPPPPLIPCRLAALTASPCFASPPQIKKSLRIASPISEKVVEQLTILVNSCITDVNK
ncbi:hypothetical protein E2C01_064271 [Portunus trituberculatus]|uniref:Uncharacterized protein n=1 Tax=Portunus trituberculatus TaxID=210409 RepID=A0A5B7HJA8_PORTR|nr:hypothetical protein [Portunus trituberculatus]